MTEVIRVKWRRIDPITVRAKVKIFFALLIEFDRIFLFRFEFFFLTETVFGWAKPSKLGKNSLYYYYWD